MLVAERDQFRDETKDLLLTKKKLEAELYLTNMTFKEKVARLEIQLKQKTDFSDLQAENLLKL